MSKKKITNSENHDNDKRDIKKNTKIKKIYIKKRYSLLLNDWFNPIYSYDDWGKCKVL